MEILQDKKNDIITQFVDSSVIDALSNLLNSSDHSILVSTSCEIAALFGNVRDFVSFVNADAEKMETAEKKLITSFFNNLNLLVQKTWVEKSDEALKEQVLDRLSKFCAEVQNKSYIKAYTLFSTVVHDAVYLMFGPQAKKEDFGEYALRIDPGFGIFWWYVANLPAVISWTDEKTRTILILGMFFLANY